MRYILPCLLPEPIRAYHAALLDEIATRFDLPYTRRQGIPAHFTLNSRARIPSRRWRWAASITSPRTSSS